MKKLIVAVVAILVLLGGGYALVVLLYNPESQRAALEQRLEEAFGRPVDVGPMRLTFAGGLGVEARDVRVAQDPSFGDGTLLVVDRVTADIGIWDYIVNRRPAIESLVLERPHLTVVKRQDGVWNFTALGAGAQAASRRAKDAPRGGTLLAAALGPVAALADAAAATPGHIEAADAVVTMIDRTASPATETVYRGLALSADVERQGDAYHLSNGRVWGDSAAAGGEPLTAEVPFDVTLTPPGAVPVWQASGSISNGALATRNLGLDAITTGFALDASQMLRFAPLSVGLYGGRFEGESSLNLAAPNNRFTAAGTVTSVSLGQALAPRPDLANTLDGRMTSRFDVTGELGDFDWTVGSLRGGGHVVLDDARLSSVNLLSEIAQQGGFQRIEFAEPGTHARRIETGVRFEGGRVHFENATVDDINGYANLRADSGWLELKSPATISLTGSATLLPPLFEKVTQADPVAGAVISAVNANSQVTVPLTVSGPVTSPAVSVQWGRVLGPFLPFGVRLPGS